MTTLVRIDGRNLSPEEATIPVFDRGFLYGDSIYDVIRTYDGRPFMLDEHLARLRRSGAAIRLEIPLSDEQIASEVRSVIADAGNAESYVRMMVTRGVGPIDLAPPDDEDPTLIIIVRALDDPTDEEWSRGVRIAVVHPARPHPGAPRPTAKTGNYLTNVVAKIDARHAGADDALMLNADGDVAEGTTWNLFVVKDGRLSTPSNDSGLLPGLTRGLVLEVLRDEGVACEERRVRPEEVLAADELFLTSSTRGVVPVVAVDDQQIANGKPGPLTRQVRTAYEGRVRRR
jgi:branched-chain amino acid aminotransferase